MSLKVLQLKNLFLLNLLNSLFLLFPTFSFLLDFVTLPMRVFTVKSNSDIGFISSKKPSRLLTRLFRNSYITYYFDVHEMQAIVFLEFLPSTPTLASTSRFLFQWKFLSIRVPTSFSALVFKNRACSFMRPRYFMICYSFVHMWVFVNPFVNADIHLVRKTQIAQTPSTFSVIMVDLVITQFLFTNSV